MLCVMYSVNTTNSSVIVLTFPIDGTSLFFFESYLVNVTSSPTLSVLNSSRVIMLSFELIVGGRGIEPQHYCFVLDRLAIRYVTHLIMCSFLELFCPVCQISLAKLCNLLYLCSINKCCYLCFTSAKVGHQIANTKFMSYFMPNINIV